MSTEFIEWVWNTDYDKPVFCGGIYHNTKADRYSTTLSDLRKITFPELEQAREWLLAKKRGEHRNDNPNRD